MKQFFASIKAYLSEPIISLIAYHVVFIILVAGVILYAQYHARVHYLEPARGNIENQNNKKELAYIITRELQGIEVHYNEMLLSSNLKKINILSKKYNESRVHINRILLVLENGGQVTDKLPVNFYDKDDLKEKISYVKTDRQEILLELLNLSPKLEELNSLWNKTETRLVQKLIQKDLNPISSDFDMLMVTKQTHAILLRLQEGANKIFYDIRLANTNSQSSIAKVQTTVQQIVLAINILGNFLVILFAFLIAFRIFKILEKEKESTADNRKLSTVIEQTPASIVITDASGNIEYANQFFRKITGYAKEDLTGVHTRILKSGKTPDETYRQMWQTITDGRNWEGELCNKRKDGSLFHEHAVIAPVFNDRNQINNFVAVKLDITDKIELQKKVETSNAAMRAVIENIPVGVVLIDSNKKIIQINEPASRILKFDSFEQAKQTLLQSYCYETYCDINPSACPILDLGKKNMQFTEKELISGGRHSGEKITILKSVIPIFMNDQYLFMEVFVDISARKKHEQALEALVKERTKKLEDTQKELINKAVDSGRAQLSAMVLHNIGNAITPVTVVVEQLRQNKISQTQHYLMACHNDLLNHKDDLNRYIQHDPRGMKVAEYMGELIKELGIQLKTVDDMTDKCAAGIAYVAEILSVQSAYAPGREEIKERVNLNRVVEDALKIQERFIRKQDIMLETDLDAGIPRLVIEKNKMMQVVVNLIKNACDAIIESNHTKAHTIHIATFEKNNRVCLEISDSGCGIDPDKLESIFNFGVSTKGSSGFGLYYCKNFVERNNGRMHITSKGRGHGAVVTLELNKRINALPDD